MQENSMISVSHWGMFKLEPTVDDLPKDLYDAVFNAKLQIIVREVLAAENPIKAIINK